jgi:hypothetical protein
VVQRPVAPRALAAPMGELGGGLAMKKFREKRDHVRVQCRGNPPSEWEVWDRLTTLDAVNCVQVAPHAGGQFGLRNLQAATSRP